MPGLIAVLCRNSLPLTKRCLPTLLAQQGQPDVLMIDNASTDGTAHYLLSAASRHQPPPTLWRMSFGAVQGVAKAWNDALRWGWQKGCEEVLVVNNDLELSPLVYEHLRVFMKDHSDCGVVTGVSAGEEALRRLDRQSGSSPHPDFACFMMARWCWDRVGPFDEGYEGAYFEDNDMHVRMHRAGIKAVAIDVPFLHHRSSTIGGAGPEERRRIERNYDRNRERFHRQYGCYPGTVLYDELFA